MTDLAERKLEPDMEWTEAFIRFGSTYKIQNHNVANNIIVVLTEIISTTSKNRYFTHLYRHAL